MPYSKLPLSATLFKDVTASIVVFLVALPLCLGIALASGAPLFSGILAGIIGGIVVGLLSGSHTSVTGPAAGLTAIVAAQIGNLGTFNTFLLAVMLAGLLQIILGICKAGFISSFFPSGVIKGLLSAIGIILILKQIPHLIGHDPDPEGEMSFSQPDHENTFTELWSSLFDIQPGAAVVGILSLLILVFWDKIKVLKKTGLPAPLIVVVFGVGISMLLRQSGGSWAISTSHLVQVPVAEDLASFLGFLQLPNFAAFSNPDVYLAAITIAIVASLETLLTIEAVYKMDPEQRGCSPHRELLAQGVGNFACGMIGGLPVTSVVVRSAANVNSGNKTKLSTILHGVLLFGCVLMVPGWLNEIPLAALAAILLVTGFKLASPKIIKQMIAEGRKQYLPYFITVVAIVFTDLLTGILIGLAVSIGFILHSNMRRPLSKIMEKHPTGDVLRIELANQVSFFSRAALDETLRNAPRGSHVLLDARGTNYIDVDILDLIQDFQNNTAPAHKVQLSLVGFKDKYPKLEDRIQFMDFTSREVQSGLAPSDVLEILRAGNQRFLSGERIERDYSRQVSATAVGQFPMAAVLGCIDSRAPAEVVFDLGLGDIFSARVAGNIATTELLGSIEYACAVVGAKLIVVLGHTSCGAVNAAVDLLTAAKKASEATPCVNLDGLVAEIQVVIDPRTLKQPDQWAAGEKAAYTDQISRLNVMRTIRIVRERSTTLDALVKSGKLAVVGALYDVNSGEVSFFQTSDSSLVQLPIPMVTTV